LCRDGRPQCHLLLFVTFVGLLSMAIIPILRTCELD
jgi:hypothetical protein